MNSKWIKLLELLQFNNSRSRKNWTNSCLQFYPLCFVVWKFSYRINCLQNTNIEKTDKYVDRKHGHVRPALSNIPVPPSTGRVSRWLVDYWWYPWPSFMQATHLSCECFWGSIDSEPGSDSSGSIWSCCSSTPLSSRN